MTSNKAIENVDRLKLNVYSEEDKLRWINELDGMVQRLVIQTDEVTEYVYPDDMDRELLIPAPFDDCYTLFLEAKIDYYNREYANYNNSAMMFEAQFSEYKKAYIREHQARG
jgi:streptogramin lyase